MKSPNLRRLTMQCPVCKTVHLIMADRSGIEIDYCPQCRGVWLDRGELDKIIERAAPQAGVPPAAAPASRYPAAPASHYPAAPPSYPPQGGYYRKKKREGFLGELFDFD
jgi:hypothetical protein